MGWILVPCLVALRNEFNELAPQRDKTSDGSIGDVAHQHEPSDHNPDETGDTPTKDADHINEVHAIDVDDDLRCDGWSMERAVQIIVGRHKSGADNRLQYVIYNRRIWSRSWGWTQHAYTGPSPHTEHAHFSARYTTAQESDTRPWGLLAEQSKEDDMSLDAEELTQIRQQVSLGVYDAYWAAAHNVDVKSGTTVLASAKVGRAIHDNLRSILVTDVLSALAAVGAATNIDAAELQAIKDAARQGAAIAGDAVIEQIKAALPADLLDRADVVDAVETGVRNAFAGGLADDTE